MKISFKRKDIDFNAVGRDSKIPLKNSLLILIAIFNYQSCIIIDFKVRQRGVLITKLRNHSLFFLFCVAHASTCCWAVVTFSFPINFDIPLDLLCKNPESLENRSIFILKYFLNKLAPERDILIVGRKWWIKKNLKTSRMSLLSQVYIHVVYYLGANFETPRRACEWSLWRL